MNNISPIDGRYQKITMQLSSHFSEFGFFNYRLYVELLYFVSLIDVLPELEELKKLELKSKAKNGEIKSQTKNGEIKSKILKIAIDFDEHDYVKIKEKEEILKHDIKALEYFIRDKFVEIGLEKYTSFIHFGITSQDINTSANILSLKSSIINVVIPELNKIVEKLDLYKKEMSDSVMLSFTHQILE